MTTKIYSIKLRLVLVAILFSSQALICSGVLADYDIPDGIVDPHEICKIVKAQDQYPETCPASVADNQACSSKQSETLHHCTDEINKYTAKQAARVMETLQTKLAAEVGPLAAQRAKAASVLAQVNRINIEFRPRFTEAESEYISLMTKCEEDHKKNWLVIAGKISDSASKANTANRQELFALLKSLQDIYDDEIDRGEEYLRASEIVKGKVSGVSAAYGSALEPFMSDINELGFKAALFNLNDLTEGLSKLDLYAKNRQQQISAAISDLKNQIDTKILQLNRAELNAEVTPTETAALELSTSAKYFNKIDNEIKLAVSNDSVSPTLGLKFLWIQYKRLKSLSDLNEKCDELSRSMPWTSTGCIRLAGFAPNITRILNHDMKREVANGISLIATSKPQFRPEMRLQVMSLLASGDIAGAVRTFDEILRIGGSDNEKTL